MLEVVLVENTQPCLRQRSGTVVCVDEEATNIMFVRYPPVTRHCGVCVTKMNPFTSGTVCAQLKVINRVVLK